MKRGKYNLKKRAERQQETRLRIARATLELHDPERRLRQALGELYSYFRRRERLWANVLRDQEMLLDDPEALEADAEIMEPIFLHWERMRETLAPGWGPPY